jgi:hypothetical protein
LQITKSENQNHVFPSVLASSNLDGTDVFVRSEIKSTDKLSPSVGGTRNINDLMS